MQGPTRPSQLTKATDNGSSAQTRMSCGSTAGARKSILRDRATWAAASIASAASGHKPDASNAAWSRSPCVGVQSRWVTNSSSAPASDAASTNPGNLFTVSPREEIAHLDPGCSLLSAAGDQLPQGCPELFQARPRPEVGVRRVVAGHGDDELVHPLVPRSSRSRVPADLRSW